MTVLNRFNKTFCISVTPVITAGGYSANDVVGGVMKFSLGGALGCMLEQVMVVDDANQKAALDLYFLVQDLTTPIADNGPFATGPVIADLKTALRNRLQIAAADYVTLNNNAYAIMGRQTPGTPTTAFAPLNMPFALTNEWLWVYAVCTGSPTFAATGDLTFILSGWKD